ncbi:MAG: hypothetical protein D5R96_05765 [Methanocalculus sp. MSAO_Arc2]|uniref:archaellin/type IV pilin N-terminal domain-containing protein n=1 Tax=Methanocalculus sp. MSAO_Arc2 TaxID=2293855 RepID=UPI000FF75450|nr:MAG: hypothetical protein D5R96_05765 [Methanocalculus sp. MSAO_Arc2]
MGLFRSDDGVSQVVGVIILVAITIILALLLLLMLHIPLWWSYGPADGTPEIFIITELNHHSPQGDFVEESFMTIMHSGTAIYRNHDLRAEVYVNDIDSGALIFTLNGHMFISTYHIGVRTLGGPGSWGNYWRPGEPVYINLNRGTFGPGDLVRFDVYHKEHGGLISRSEKIA